LYKCNIFCSLVVVGVGQLYFGKLKILLVQTWLPLSKFLRSDPFKVSMLAHPATGQLERPGTDDGVQQTVWMLRDIPFAPKRGSERQERVEEHRKPDLDRQS
jgi:Phosphate transport (Pho88)